MVLIVKDFREVSLYQKIANGKLWERIAEVEIVLFQRRKGYMTRICEKGKDLQDKHGNVQGTEGLLEA